MPLSEQGNKTRVVSSFGCFSVKFLMLKVTQNTAQLINILLGYLESLKYEKFLLSLKNRGDFKNKVIIFSVSHSKDRLTF